MRKGGFWSRKGIRTRRVGAIATWTRMISTHVVIPGTSYNPGITLDNSFIILKINLINVSIHVLKVRKAERLR